MPRSNVLKSLFALVFLFINGPAYAVDANCLAPDKHEAVTYLLIDRSDELKDVDNLKQSLVVLKKMLSNGERLIVGVSTGKASETRVLMDMVLPKKSLWVSKLKIRAGEKKFDDCFKKIEEEVLVQNEKHSSSALLETLRVVSKALESDSSKTKRVIVYSDMVQNSASISFYKSKVVDPEKILKQVEKEFLLATFSNTDFHVAGVGTGVSDKKARSIEQFWRKYIEKSGGNLRFYGPVLFAS